MSQGCNQYEAIVRSQFVGLLLGEGSGASGCGSGGGFYVHLLDPKAGAHLKESVKPGDVLVGINGNVGSLSLSLSLCVCVSISLSVSPQPPSLCLSVYLSNYLSTSKGVAGNRFSH